VIDECIPDTVTLVLTPAAETQWAYATVLRGGGVVVVVCVCVWRGGGSHFSLIGGDKPLLRCFESRMQNVSPLQRDTASLSFIRLALEMRAATGRNPSVASAEVENREPIA